MTIPRKIALITGITGQDGSYLAELLLDKGYEVHGIVRPEIKHGSAPYTENIAHLNGLSNFILHSCDITHDLELADCFKEVLPDEIYHLAAQSNTPMSFIKEWDTFETNIRSTLTLLTLIKEYKPLARFYFAASSELFGDAIETPQNEETVFNPNSPYGISKVAGYYLTKLYREKYSLFACSGICFSHESPRRPDIFVTRKITSTVAKIKFGVAKELRIGNLETKRDWGFSGDFVLAIWQMLQQDRPEDYVIGTGVNYSIKEFIEKAFEYVGLDWRNYVVSDPLFYRPQEKNSWLADITKAKQKLGWEPKFSFKMLVETMVDNDLEIVRKQLSK